MNTQESTEMYLKNILILEKRNGTVRAVDIARQMQFSRPTVSQQLKNLAARGYLEINEKKQILLTPQGRQVAEATSRFHNGLIDFFKMIGVSEDTAFEDACRMEHYISEETFDRIKEFLDNCSQYETLREQLSKDS